MNTFKNNIRMAMCLLNLDFNTLIIKAFVNKRKTTRAHCYIIELIASEYLM